MLYQLSYASQIYRKPVACNAIGRGAQRPATISAQTIRLAQGGARGKPAAEPEPAHRSILRRRERVFFWPGSASALLAGFGLQKNLPILSKIPTEFRI